MKRLLQTLSALDKLDAFPLSADHEGRAQLYATVAAVQREFRELRAVSTIMQNPPAVDID